METYLLKENVLSDDVLHLATENKVFKGGYIGIVEFFTFASAWCDKKHIKRFRTEKSLNKFLNRNYKEFTY